MKQANGGTNRIPMQFPYGAVYFRKSNPPREQWENDYRRARDDGYNLFRHWFMWGAIEIAPGVYDWDDYDRQIELGEKYGIRTIIAEITNCVPEWLAAEHPEWLCEDPKHTPLRPVMGGSTATGGFCAGLCCDKSPAWEHVAGFLTTLSERYKGAAGVLGYDVDNESNRDASACWCPDTAAAYRAWLLEKYGDLDTIRRVWHRYSLSDIAQINPPAALQFAPDSMDWLAFRKDSYYEYVQRKIALISSIDKTHLITAHGLGSTLTHHTAQCCDEWSAAKNVEVYGYTWVQSRHGNDPWMHWLATDITRAGTRGDKPFWHAEAQGGPLWLQPQVSGRARDDGRVSSAEDVRIWNYTSMAAGASGILYPRWRPLLDGPLFGAFGPYAMDGGSTPRSEMASVVAKWANDPTRAELFAAKPVRGDIGILFLPECEQASHLLSRAGRSNIYPDCMQGAYRAFFDSNIQADFVQADDIGRYDVLYLSDPVAVSQEHADALRVWVGNGGTLLSESCPAYFDERLHASPEQPGGGLRDLFGVRESNVEFMPDLYDAERFEIDGMPVFGAGFLQTYALAGAETLGMRGGEVIAAVNRYGKGRTLLIGFDLSLSYFRHSQEENRLFFASLLPFAGKRQRIGCDNGKIKARLHVDGQGNHTLWALNMDPMSQACTLTFQEPVSVNRVDHGEAFGRGVDGCGMQLEIGGRDAFIARIGFGAAD